MEASADTAQAKLFDTRRDWLASIRSCSAREFFPDGHRILIGLIYGSDLGKDYLSSFRILDHSCPGVNGLVK